MKCMKCHNTLHSEIGEFSMTINGKSIKVINAPVLHCKNCNSVIISDEVKEKAKEFSTVSYPYITSPRNSNYLLYNLGFVVIKAVNSLPT